MVKNRVVGLIITTIGLIILTFSLTLACLEYTSARNVDTSSIEDAITGLINVFTNIIPRLIWVGVMIAIGSIMLGRGVQLLRAEEK